MKNRTYSTEYETNGIDLAELTTKIAQVKGGLDFVANELGSLCDEERAKAILVKANKRLGEVQEALYDVMYTNK